MFDPIFNGNTARTRRPLAVGLSFAGQIVVVGLVVLVPVLRPEGIALGGLLRVITAPPGRGEPGLIKQKAAPHTGVTSSGPRIFVDRTFRWPDRVPRGVLPVQDEPPANLPAGIAGPAIPGAMNGVPWGTGTGAVQLPKPAPERPARPVVAAQPPRLRVGGVVQAAKIMRQVMPVYPQPARAAHISGTVRIEAVISRDGTIQSLRVMSGHPWLVEAALDAVRQWIYQPTLLNGEPVEVLTQIEVNFKLGQ